MDGALFVVLGVNGEVVAGAVDLADTPGALRVLADDLGQFADQSGVTPTASGSLD
jgi:hypothetical protein